MKLKNTSDWPDYFLRRLISFCCKELGLPQRKIREAVFRKKRIEYMKTTEDGTFSRYTLKQENQPGFKYSKIISYSGHAWTSTMRFVITTQPGDIHNLVLVTAHEIAHLLQGWEARQNPNWREAMLSERSRDKRKRLKVHGGSERDTCWHEKQVMEKFNANKESLLAEWNLPPKPKSTPKLQASPQTIRATKAAQQLAHWKKKLRFAQNKVRKYNQRINYYTRQSQKAACSSNPS